MTPPRWQALPIGQDRGTLAMKFFIVNESLLFIVLLFGWIYVGHERERWPPEPPKLMLPLIMLGTLIVSSGVLYAGERLARRGKEGPAKFAVVVTILLGLAFLAMQGVEYHNHLAKLRPTTNAYGSFFYTITSIHGLHLTLGLCLLLYTLILPRIGKTKLSPHMALHNASLYWHFVDVVWLVLVIVVYAIPRAIS